MAAMDAKGSAFLKAINEASLEQRSAVISELDQYKKQQLREARDDAEKKYEEYIAAKTGELNSEDGIEATRRSAELRSCVMNTRSEIFTKVFNKAKERIIEFTRTGEYEKLLVESAAKMAEKCGDSPIEIYLKSTDMKYSESLKHAVPSITDVKQDDSVEIGGLYGICTEKRVKFNDLLETRLEEQKAWFLENSGLTL